MGGRLRLVGTMDLTVIGTSSYDEVGSPPYTGFNTCEDLLGSLRPIRVDHTKFKVLK